MGTANDKPPYRRLQVFSLDPSADVRMDTALISRSVLHIRWETLQRGPIGEYLEVIDVDPSSNCVYESVDLDKKLATDGIAPSGGNPKFHQQMAYAVAMLTIQRFEQVLGRHVLWADRRKDENGKYLRTFDPRRFTRRLRIYPHALREQNAYYSPTKKALLFGYFNAPTADPRDELPGGLVFTCLSHDIIAHETTHAILDGIHRRLLDTTNPDMLAFHEAFADIVAIFQHFTLPGLLLDQIKKTRGNLNRDNLLVQLASQFARSTNRGNALRNALGEFDKNGKRKQPDPAELGRTTEPHARGAILVAAVFDAFLRIYEDRVADLKRIASGGTGILQEGEIHPDLAHRFVSEALEAADRVLTICIRAVDYLPPVDITFGDYIRALITADADLIPDDPRRHRLAFIEAFRDRGIYPLDVRTLSEDTLRWRRSSPSEVDKFRPYLPPNNVLRTMAYAYGAAGSIISEFLDEEREIFKMLARGDFDGAAGAFLDATWQNGNSINSNLNELDERWNRGILDKAFAIFLHRWITQRAKEEKRREEDLEEIGWYLGLDIKGLNRGEAPLEVHAVRPTLRIRPDGQSKVELLVMLTQWRSEPVFDQNGEPMTDASGEPVTFKFRGGCTLIIDPETGTINYNIVKALTSERRKGRNAAFQRDQMLRDRPLAMSMFDEPLAGLHGEDDDEGGY